MPPGFVHPVLGVPGVAVHVASDGTVSIQRDRIPFHEHDLGLPPGEQHARIVATLLAVLHQPAPPDDSKRVTVGGVSWPTPNADEPLPVHKALARWTLRRDREDAERYGEAALIEAEELLAAAIAVDLRRFARSARRFLQGARTPAYSWRRIEEDLEAGGSLWLDEDGAAWLEQGPGDLGKEFADLLRKGSQERAEAWRNDEPLPGMPRDDTKIWHAWLNEDTQPTPVPWANFLAKAIWFEEVKPSWRIEQDRREEAHEREERAIAPARVSQMAMSLSMLSSKVSIDDETGRFLVRGSDTKLRAAPAVDLDALRAMARVLHTIPARRTVYWYTQAAWRVYIGDGTASGDRWFARQQADDSIFVVVEGGHQQLAKLVGETTNTSRNTPFATMSALSQAHLTIETSNSQHLGALVAKAVATRGSRAGPGRIEITLSPLWSVGAVNALQGSDRLLVPILNVPPMSAIAEVLQPRVAALEEAALVFLAKRSPELTKRGGVRIPWRELARERRVSEEVAAKAVTSWRDSDRWRLTAAGDRLGEADDVVSRAHELLIEGGTRRVKASERGRKSADKKRG